MTVDGTGLREGDYAGLCVLESCYGFVAITRRDSSLYLVMGKREITEGGFWGERHDTRPFEEIECIKLESPIVTLCSVIAFDHKSMGSGDCLLPYPEDDDTARFGYKDNDGTFKEIGKAHKLKFLLDHFTGARFGLFVYSTRETGGSAGFSDFNLYV